MPLPRIDPPRSYSVKSCLNYTEFKAILLGGERRFWPENKQVQSSFGRCDFVRRRCTLRPITAHLQQHRFLYCTGTGPSGFLTDLSQCPGGVVHNEPYYKVFISLESTFRTHSSIDGLTIIPYKWCRGGRVGFKCNLLVCKLQQLCFHTSIA